MTRIVVHALCTCVSVYAFVCLCVCGWNKQFFAWIRFRAPSTVARCLVSLVCVNKVESVRWTIMAFAFSTETIETCISTGAGEPTASGGMMQQHIYGAAAEVSHTTFEKSTVRAQRRPHRCKQFCGANERIPANQTHQTQLNAITSGFPFAFANEEKKAQEQSRTIATRSQSTE